MYGAGLLASVSPCVWGLLPLTMSYISTAAGEREDKQATLPTLAFAAGLAADPVLGAVLLLGYTLGYSTPLLLAASTGGQFLANLQGGDYGKIAPWITPLTGGILLWYGTNGILTAVLGDPSMSGLAPIIV